MAHLAEDTAIRAGDALDGEDGAVGVVLHVHAGAAVLIDVLGRDLAVGDEGVQHALRCHEAALTVADGHGVLVAHAALGQPGAAGGGDAGAHQHTLVAADGVEGQGRVAGRDGADVAVSGQTQLDEGLEAVADTQHQTIPVLQQVADCLSDRRIAEEGGDELCAAVRLVAAGEAAGQHDDLALVDGLDQCLAAGGDISGGQVADDQHLGVRTGAGKGVGGVVLAVGTREDRDDDLRLCHADLGRSGGGQAAVDLLDGGAGLAVGIDGLELALPDLLQLSHIQLVAAALEGVVRGGLAQQLTSRGVRDHLQHDGAVHGLKHIVGGHVVHHLEADAVAQTHLEESLGQTAIAHRGSSGHHAIFHHLLNFLIVGLQGEEVGAAGDGVQDGPDEDDGALRLLELGGDDAAGLADGGGEGHQRGRHIQLLEGAGHAVLTADGGDAEADLRVQCAQQSGQRLAPALRGSAKALEVLLEGQVGVLIAEAGGHQLGHTLDDGHPCAHILVGAHEVGVVAPCHAGAGVGLAVHGQLCDHGVLGGQLACAAEGHQHGGRADGGVEPLRKALLAADVQIAHHVLHLLLKGHAGPLGLPDSPLLDVDVLVLLSAVGVQELAADVDDGLAVPHHVQALFLGDLCHGGGLKVLLGGDGDEFVHVLRGQSHSHTLLALADGQLGAVEAVILLGDLVQVDIQAVGQLADGDRDAAGAEVVAALDHLAGVFAAEQALQLALDGGVALLDLSTAVLEAVQLVGLGGTGGTADAVAAGAAAQQDDDVAGSGAFAADVGSGRCAHNSADLHPLCHIAGVIDLIHLTGSKADLVAVGGITGGSGGHQLALGQLAGQGLTDGLEGVACAGDAHGLIDVAAARQRVADRTADAGGSAAEGLDLRRVVVGLVLEEEQPVLILAVDVALDLHGAGVDFLRLVEVLQDALLFQFLGTDGGQVHHAAGLILAAKVGAHCHIAVEGLLHHGIVDLDVVQNGSEGGVAAVVRPVCVDHLDLGDGRVALLRAEILLAELDVAQVHGEALLVDELFQACLIQLVEAVQHLHFGGDGILHLQGSPGVQRSLAGLHRVDDVFLDLSHLLIGQGAFQQVDAGRAHQRAVALADELDALGGRVGALVELAGQILHGERHAVGDGQLCVGVIHRRLTEHGGDALIEQSLVDALHVVAVEQTQTVQLLDAQQRDELIAQALGLAVEAGFLFNIDTIYHWKIPLVVSPLSHLR